MPLAPLQAVRLGVFDDVALLAEGVDLDLVDRGRLEAELREILRGRPTLEDLQNPRKPTEADMRAGFERHESSDNARHLLEVHLMAPTPSAPHTPRGAATRARAAQVGGIPAEMLLEESVSLETVGNAFYTRTIHTDVRGLRRLAALRVAEPRLRNGLKNE